MYTVTAFVAVFCCFTHQNKPSNVAWNVDWKHSRWTSGIHADDMYAVEKERIPLIQLLWTIIIYCEHINNNNSGNNRIIIKKNVSVHFGSRIQVKSSQVSWAHGCRWWLWWCIVMSKTMFSFYEFHCLKLTAHQRRFHTIFRSIFRAHLYHYVCVCVLFVHTFI